MRQKTYDTRNKAETGHTPGPWTVSEYKLGFGREVVANDGSVCTVAGTSGTQKEAEANARLIAAAPELFRALVATWIIIEGSPDMLDRVGHCTSKDTGKTLHETVRAIIARAT